MCNLEIKFPCVSHFFCGLSKNLICSTTTTNVQIKELELHLVLISAGILLACTVLRALLTSACAVRSNLNTKEKFFVGLSWMAKATVQVNSAITNKVVHNQQQPIRSRFCYTLASTKPR